MKRDAAAMQWQRYHRRATLPRRLSGQGVVLLPLRLSRNTTPYPLASLHTADKWSAVGAWNSRQANGPIGVVTTFGPIVTTGSIPPMEHNNNTSTTAETLHHNRRDLEDVTLRVQELVGTLTVYVDQALITPKALPLWLPASVASRSTTY